MGLLDDLKKQAEMVTTQQKVQQSLREDALRLVEETMGRTFRYLSELLKQLAVLKPTNPTKFLIPGIGELEDLGFTDSFIDYRSKRINDRDYFGSIGFFLKWGSGNILVVERDMPAAAQKIRDALFSLRLKFTEDEVRKQRGAAPTWRFSVESAIVTDVKITADHDQGRLLIVAKNLTRLGTDDYIVPAPELNDALLEEFAKALLGQPSGLRKYRTLIGTR